MLNVSSGLAGLTVNCENTVVPNPSCCSNPSVLCPDCARKVLTRNVADDEELEIVDTSQDGEDEEPLPVPSWPSAETDMETDEPVANQDEFLSIPGNPWRAK